MSRIRRERALRQPRITVIGEGLTERWYFTHLRSIMGFRYDCKPRFFTHQSYGEMRKLTDWVLQNGGIAVCICDADITRTNDDESKHLKEMKEAYADNDRVCICDSMPSIEFWFLIHYLNTSRYFNNSSAVIQELRRFVSNYAKTGEFLEKPQWVAELCAGRKLATACERASNLDPESESYSNIYKAIKLFCENKSSSR